MFEEFDRMQHYYHQLMQQAEELEQQSYRLRHQAEEGLRGIHPDFFAENMLSCAEETARQMRQAGEMLRAQAAEVKRWLDNAAVMIPPIPPVNLNV